MDNGATNQMSSNDGTLLSRRPSPSSSVEVSDGNSLIVTCQGDSLLASPSSNFALKNVHVVPSFATFFLYVDSLVTITVLLNLTLLVFPLRIHGPVG